MCGLHCKEDTFHFAAVCPALQEERAAFRADVRGKLPGEPAFTSEDASDWFRWVVNGPPGVYSKRLARRFDTAARIFVKKLWAKRLRCAGVFTARRAGSKGVLQV